MRKIGGLEGWPRSRGGTADGGLTNPRKAVENRSLCFVSAEYNVEMLSL